MFTGISLYSLVLKCGISLYVCCLINCLSFIKKKQEWMKGACSCAYFQDPSESLFLSISWFSQMDFPLCKNCFSCIIFYICFLSKLILLFPQLVNSYYFFYKNSYHLFYFPRSIWKFTFGMLVALFSLLFYHKQTNSMFNRTFD